MIKFLALLCFCAGSLQAMQPQVVGIITVSPLDSQKVRALDALVKKGRKDSRQLLKTQGLCYKCKAKTTVKCCPCVLVAYCSVACQQADWQNHKEIHNIVR